MGRETPRWRPKLPLTDKPTSGPRWGSGLWHLFGNHSPHRMARRGAPVQGAVRGKTMCPPVGRNRKKE